MCFLIYWDGSTCFVTTRDLTPRVGNWTLLWFALRRNLTYTSETNFIVKLVAGFLEDSYCLLVENNQKVSRVPIYFNLAVPQVKIVFWNLRHNY